MRIYQQEDANFRLNFERANLCEELSDLSDLVCQWFRQLHKTAGMKVPTSLREPKDGTRPDSMTVEFLENKGTGVSEGTVGFGEEDCRRRAPSQH